MSVLGSRSGLGDHRHSSAEYQPLEDRDRKGINISKHYQKGKTQQCQRVMVAIVVIFIIVSALFSLLPGQSSVELITKPRYSNGINTQSMLVGTSQKSLTWAERNDRSWSDVRCRKEFPLLYPQLEELVQFWKERGGLSKDIVDKNEEHVKPNDFTGYTRVSEEYKGRTHRS